MAPSAPPDSPAQRSGRADASPAAAKSLSVVIPVHDGGVDFERCLTALARADQGALLEVIVVDDASTDGSGDRAAERGWRVVRMAERSGPAAARNAGAGTAAGDVLLFVDADCEVHADTLSRVAAAFQTDRELDALFGSYDDSPSAPGAVSRFKNLYHHWTHQRGAEAARTFWAGCGAIRRERFLALGGFDALRYARPSIEDIDLGYRVSEAGGRIRLAKQVQVKHLKRWTLASLVRTDIWQRGVPWMELLRERPGRGGELNLGVKEKLVVATGLTVPVALAAAIAVPAARWLALAAIVALVGLSWGFYVLLVRRGGAGTLLAAIPLHVLYCYSCAVAFVVGTARARDTLRRSREAHG